MATKFKTKSAILYGLLKALKRVVLIKIDYINDGSKQTEIVMEVNMKLIKKY